MAISDFLWRFCEKNGIDPRDYLDCNTFKAKPPADETEWADRMLREMRSPSRLN